VRNGRCFVIIDLNKEKGEPIWIPIIFSYWRFFLEFFFSAIRHPVSPQIEGGIWMIFELELF
jgi:hypothetical protein